MSLTVTNLLQNISGIISSGSNDWGSLHPLVIHFPIALLFTAPLFVILGLVIQRSGKIFFICALILMLLGTAGIFIATSTGDSAAEPLEANPAIVSTLDAHVRLGERSRLIFSILTALFLIYVAFQAMWNKKFNRPVHAVVICLFLLVYTLALIILFNAAHYGGTLVHQHGIRSALYSK